MCPISPLLPASSPPVRCFLAGLLVSVLHRMRRNIPALLLIVEGQAAGATPGTGPAGASPKASWRQASRWPSF